MFKNRIANQAGMTLIEILIVLAIIGSLSAVLISQVTERLQKSKVSETKIIIGQVTNSLNMYYTDCGKYPETLEGLVKADANCSNWGPEPYMKKMPKDAWNNDFQYSVEGGNFTLKSQGKDGKPGGDGYNKDLSNNDE